jgi:hypothetical protein
MELVIFPPSVPKTPTATAMTIAAMTAYSAMVAARVSVSMFPPVYVAGKRTFPDDRWFRYVLLRFGEAGLLNHLYEKVGRVARAFCGRIETPCLAGGFDTAAKITRPTQPPSLCTLPGGFDTFRIALAMRNYSTTYKTISGTFVPVKF